MHDKEYIAAVLGTYETSRSGLQQVKVNFGAATTGYRSTTGWQLETLFMLDKIMQKTGLEIEWNQLRTI